MPNNPLPLRKPLTDPTWLLPATLFFALDILLSLAGLLLDPTLISGAPAWLKPLKFALSTFLFCPALAWMLHRLPRFPRLITLLGRITALCLILEILLIDLQAARHTTSHFNYSTPLNSLIFATMGVGIACVSLITLVFLVLSFLQTIPSRPQLWAIRLSLLLALAGMAVGPLMTLPTPDQLAAYPTSHRMTHIGAHTVGAPDGGPGLPLTRWSANHGDLRIAHFVGLHAMQLLLAPFWLASTRLRTLFRPTLPWLFAIASLSTATFAIVLVQALHGQPLLHPGHLTQLLWISLAILATLTLFPRKEQAQ